MSSKCIANQSVILRRASGKSILELSGRWVIERSVEIENEINKLDYSLVGNNFVADFKAVMQMDTVGAHLFLKMVKKCLPGKSENLEYVNLDNHYRGLIELVAQPEVKDQAKSIVVEKNNNLIKDIVVNFGKATVDLGNYVKDILQLIGHLIVIVCSFGLKLKNWRLTSVVNQFDQIIIKAAFIVTLMNFTIGMVIAQQAAAQLSKFGAENLVVNLVGILVLREIGVVLASILVAGRSGSAFAAELGSMVMREEIDAIKCMGLSHVKLLIFPRMAALLLGLPMLTILANLSALVGAALVSKLMLEVSFIDFWKLVLDVVTVKMFVVGLVKSPFMALIIGTIATIEGLRVRSSIDSLGRHTTAAVVWSIFTVILFDGLFAIFFVSAGI